jgi:hypothetical protein
VTIGSFAGAAIWQYESMRLVGQENLKLFSDGYQSVDSFYGKAGEARRRVGLAQHHKIKF